MVKTLLKKATLMALLTFIAVSLFRCSDQPHPPRRMRMPDIISSFYNGKLVSRAPNIQINFTRTPGKRYYPETSEEDKEVLDNDRKGTIVTPDGEVVNVLIFDYDSFYADANVWITEVSKPINERRHLLGHFLSDGSLRHEFYITVDTMLNWQYDVIVFNFVPNVDNS